MLAALAALAAPFVIERRAAYYTDGAAIRRPESVHHERIRRVLWEEPRRLEAAVNHPRLDDYEPRLSPEGDVLVFTRGRPGENADLFHARRRAGGWSEAAPIEGINSGADELGAAFSPDGRWLLFYSDREGGEGGYDIWLSERRADGFGPPLNAGAEVNGPWNELSPSFDPAGQRLYFSSDRRPGEERRAPWQGTLRARLRAADYDIFIADLAPAAEASDAEGAGDAAPSPRFASARPFDALNRAGWAEGAVAVSPAGDFLYFASNRPGGEGGFDIYRVRLTDGEPGLPEALGGPVNSAADELDPALVAGGFAIYFSRPHAAPRPESEAGTEAEPRLQEDICYSLSREVYVERASEGPYWSLAALLRWLAALLSRLPPELLVLIVYVLFCLFLLWLLRRRLGTLNLLARCLLLALLLHLLLGLWMQREKVERLLLDLASVEESYAPFEVALEGPPEESVGAAIRDALAESALDAPPELAALPLSAPAPRVFDRLPPARIELPEPAPAAAMLPPLEAPGAPAPDAAPSALSPLAEPLPELALAPADAAAPAPVVRSRPIEAPAEAAPSAQLSLGAASPLQAPAPAPSLLPLELALPSAAPLPPPALAPASSPAAAAAPAPASAGAEPGLPDVLSLAHDAGVPAPGAEIAQARALEGPPPETPIESPVLEPAPRPRSGRAAPAALPSTPRTESDVVPLPPAGLTDLAAPAAASAPPAAPERAGSAAAAAAIEAPALDRPQVAAPAPSLAAPRQTPPAPAAAAAAEPARPRLDLARRPGPRAAPREEAAPRPATAKLDLAEASPSAAPLTQDAPRTDRDALLRSLRPLAPAPSAAPEPVRLAAEASAAENRYLPRIYTLREKARREEALRAGGGSERTERAVEAGLAWLALHQSPDGRWRLDAFADHLREPSPRDLFHSDWNNRGRRSSLGANLKGSSGDTAGTGLALLAFLGHGDSHRQEGPYRDAVDRGLKWLLKAQRPSGDLRGGGNMYMHGIAAFALAEAYAFTGDPALKQAAERAITFTARSQHPEYGGWRYEPYPDADDVDTSVFGWMMMALKSGRLGGLEVGDLCLARAANYLDSARMLPALGRYAYQPGSGRTSLAMTAQGFFCHLMLADTLPAAKLAWEPIHQRAASESVRYLLANLPRPGDMDGVNFYYWYYATLALFQHGGPAWEAWNKTLSELLIREQLGPEHGSAQGSWDPKARRDESGGRVYSTAIAVLCLEVYYRYAPIERR
jgi:hypothetical protein